LEKLSGSQLKTLMSSIPIADRYTYIFKDKPELIDHILVSPSLQVSGKSVAEILHLNNGSTKKFASDHDPILSRYNFAVSGAVSGAVLPPAEKVESREPILKDLAGAELLQKIAQNYAPKASLGYRQARDLLYTTIDNQNGVLTDIYGGFEVNIDPTDPAARTTASRLNINAEHVWPQSQGAQGNAKSDLHNLYPSVANTNGDRGNLPFADIPDTQTTSWYRNDAETNSIPIASIDDYSESDKVSFEPREPKKGDIARAMFYFRTIYPAQANNTFFEKQQATLCKWHVGDPVDAGELARSRRIAQTDQGNENPFALDAGLAKRTYCP
jgi:uncharacterized protein